MCSAGHAVIQLLVFTLCSCCFRTTQGASTWVGGCPMPCSCLTRVSAMSGRNVRTVDCANSGLELVPINISTDTECVVLSRNKLKPEDMLPGLRRLVNMTELDISSESLYSLEDWRLAFPSLLYLAMDRNYIDYLPNRTFILLRRLRTLSLSHNKIEIIHKDALYGLRDLRVLDLSHNRIYSVNDIWFRDTLSLEELDLRENNIHALRTNNFQFLTLLQRLNLSSNAIKHVYEKSFTGLERLRVLSIENNHLETVPTEEMQRFVQLQTVDLSNNHFQRLEPASFANISASVLKFNQQRMLTLVDELSFVNLYRLTKLELHSNAHLQYIDRDAFENLPLLSSLDIHGNNLSTVEGELISSLPSLSELVLYQNPIVCDCNLRWLAQEIEHPSLNLTLPNIDQTICSNLDSPTRKTGPVMETATLVPSSCSPRVLPTFAYDYNTVLGESVRLDCRAVGNPRPQLEWQLPAHQSGQLHDQVPVLKPGSRFHRNHLRVNSIGTLFIDYVQAGDHGRYTCVASSPKGKDARPVTVHVKNMRANLIIIRVTATSVTVTWRSTHYTHDYQILYKENKKNVTYHRVDIRPYMRTYTASELSPQTFYEFCIAVKYDTLSLRINCTSISTTDKAFLHEGIHSVRQYIVGGSIGILLVLVLIVCSCTYAVRKYNKKKRQQEELFGDNLSQIFLASIDSMSDTTPITYENRAAEIFDDDDIEEIRSSAASASATTLGVSGGLACSSH
jgi:Leucine-rich repeat (LRR) protein